MWMDRSLTQFEITIRARRVDRAVSALRDAGIETLPRAGDGGYREPGWILVEVEAESAKQARAEVTSILPWDCAIKDVSGWPGARIVGT
jgi:hypothetical protein